MKLKQKSKNINLLIIYHKQYKFYFNYIMNFYESIKTMLIINIILQKVIKLYFLFNFNKCNCESTDITVLCGFLFYI